MSTETETRTVAGRPITGEIQRRHRSNRPEQRPIEAFVAVLDLLFAFPEVEGVRWTQHTPSFNDGDPCVFGTHEFMVKLVGTDPEGGDYENGYFSEYGISEHFGIKYDYNIKNHHPIAATLVTELGYREAQSFEDALEDAFGDPAEVTATREGFNVEYYDCDY